MKRSLQVCFLGVGLLCLMIASASGGSYRVTDIASFGAGSFVGVTGINNHGMVVGAIDGNAFVWSDSTGIVYLPPLSGYQNSLAWGVNDAGQVVGQSESGGYQWRATLWQAGVPSTDIGVLPSGEFTPSSYACAINSSGQVVGGTTSSQGYDNPFLWTAANGIEGIGGNGSFDSYAAGINDGGTAVGARNGRAFIWTRSTGVQDIDVTGPAMNCAASDINNSGQVLGYFWSSTAGPAFVWQEGLGAFFLPSLGPQSDVLAEDINDLGEVVGGSNSQAFIWDRTKGIRALSLPLGHTYGLAGAVNDHGVVAGTSVDGLGRMHFLVWEPVPEPSSLSAMALGTVPFALVFHRRRSKRN
jgi:probable HAF family extracellular repeat protein